MSECPELFELDTDKTRVHLLRENIPPELREKADAAVRFCPTRALSLRKD